jgi:hypothetical protein
VRRFSRAEVDTLTATSAPTITSIGATRSATSSASANPIAAA